MGRPWNLLSAAWTLAAIAVAQAPISPRQWEAADREVVRLKPAAFPDLPTNLRSELQKRQCTIPQVPMIHEHHNVIKGEFAKPGQTDWAVLCSVGHVSSILIFWNGSEMNPGRIAEMKDADHLQSWGGTKIVYSRQIVAVGKAHILEHYKAYGGPTPPPIDHQGINDVFVGKASVVLYFYRGRWLKLTGAD